MADTIRTATNGYGQCHAVEGKNRALCGDWIRLGPQWAISNKPAGAVTCPACRALIKKGEGHGDSD